MTLFGFSLDLCFNSSGRSRNDVSSHRAISHKRRRIIQELLQLVSKWEEVLSLYTAQIGGLRKQWGNTEASVSGSCTDKQWQHFRHPLGRESAELLPDVKRFWTAISAAPSGWSAQRTERDSAYSALFLSLVRFYFVNTNLTFPHIWGNGFPELGCSITRYLH